MMTRGFNTLLLALAATFPLTRTVAAAPPLQGFTAPARTVIVAASESGTIAELAIREGQTVNAGQAFGFLNREVLEAQRALTAAKANQTARAKAAELELRRLQNRLDSMQKLRQDGFGSPTELELAVTERDVAHTRLDAVREEELISQLELRILEAQLSQRELKSPINGVVLKLHKQAGEFVSLADPQVATVADLSELKVRFYVPAAAAAPLRAGHQVSLRLPLSNQPAVGKLDFVAPVVDAESGTVRVEVVIENKQGRFTSGLPCTWDLENQPLIPVRRPTGRIGQQQPVRRN